jgi:hypothetical protein
MMTKSLGIAAIAALLLVTHGKAGEIARGTLYFPEARVYHVLEIYEQLTDVDLMVDSRVKSLPSRITFTNHKPLTTSEAMELFEHSLLNQAGVVVTRLDNGTISVTHNDMLPTTPGSLDEPGPESESGAEPPPEVIGTENKSPR